MRKAIISLILLMTPLVAVLAADAPTLREDAPDRYVVVPGDTLWGIAEREYGDGKQWKRVYEFNRERIANPNRPKKGTKILLPIE